MWPGVLLKMESEDGVKTVRGRGRGRGRGARGRGVRGGRGGRGRGKKNVKTTNFVEVEDSENLAPTPEAEDGQDAVIPDVAPKEIDLEADISQLEAPTFTTLNRGPPEPMLRLRWDHRVNLIAEKVLNPMIHCCDKCLKPILIYGRMIPCKHVFCLACGKGEDKVCPRCQEKVTRVEQTGLGTVFMCTHGGTRYNSEGCRRTYLSQRDLQAHINHRHIAVLSAAPLGSIGGGDAPPEPPSQVKISTMNSGSGTGSRLKASQAPPSTGDPRVQTTPPLHRRSSPPPQFVPHRPPSVMSNYQGGSGQSNMRTNLITVQIQDSNMDVPQSTFHQQHYSHGPPQYAPPYGVPPPVTLPPPQAPPFYPNPPSSYAPTPPGPPQPPPPQYGSATRPPHYQDPMAQPYAPPPPPQWQHPPNNSQQFYR